MQHFSGKQYLQIDIANSYGLDKLTWANRLAWFEAQEPILESLTRQAKEPAQFMAGVQAWRATQRNQSTGYLCGLDATASGLQLLSLLSGCHQSAKLCNLVDTGNREDAYVIIHRELCSLLQVTVDAFPIPRKDSKQALMTHLYGSKAVPKRVFGEDTPELKAFYLAVDQLLPGANQLNHELLGLWQPDALAHCWTLPDGFDVMIKVMDTITHEVKFLDVVYEVNERVNQPMTEGLSLGANIVHSIDGMVVREMNRRCNYDATRINDCINALHMGTGVSVLRQQDLSLLRILAAYEASGFMSAVIFEHLDQQNAGHLGRTAKNALFDLVNSLPDQPFSLVCIHDCFKFHANYGNDVRQQYINILAELADSEILSAIATQITNRPIPAQKITSNLAAHIRNSEYAIC